MRALSFSLVGFLVAFAIHVVVWRVFPKFRTHRNLFGLFLGLPILLYPVHRDPVILFTMLLLSANYIAIYPALQAVSPTIWILTRSETETTTTLADRTESRIQELSQDGLIIEKAGRYALTARGARLAKIFITYRQWLGIPPGDG